MQRWSQGALKHQPVEAGEAADDLLRGTLDRVSPSATIRPTVRTDDFLGFGYAEVGKITQNDPLQ